MGRFIAPVRTKGELMALAADKDRFAITLYGRTRRVIYKQFRVLRDDWKSIMGAPVFHPHLHIYVWQVIRKPENFQDMQDL